jgi:tripartite ATP-independent transporter DctM subunit
MAPDRPDADPTRDEAGPPTGVPPHQAGEPAPATAGPPTSAAPASARPPRWWTRLELGLTSAVRVATAALLLAIVLVIVWQVTARYIPNLRVPRWTEEISLILMVWLAMLGSGLAVRAGEHLSVDVLTRQLPMRARRWLERIVWLGVAGFGGYLVLFGIELAQRTMRQTMSATQLPVGWMYLGIPVGGLLIAFYSIRNMFALPTPDLDGVIESAHVRGNWTVRIALAVILLAIGGGAVVVFGLDVLLGPTGVLLGSLAAMMLLGVPIAIALGLASLVTVLALGLPPLIVAQRMANGVSSTPLLAIPFFILAGLIMAEGGIATRLVEFSRVLVGPIRGGLAMVNVVASMLFGGASGSAVADVSANGSILIPMMKKKGYDADFTVGITVASSVQGIIIPPSHNAVIYSLAAGGVSISALFLAGYVPGIMIGGALMLASYALALRRGYPSDSRPPPRESLRVAFEAIPGLMVGLIIVGGIAFGWFTATEAAAIGTVVAFLVATLIYREMNLRRLWRATLPAVRTISIVILLIASASAFAWLMAYLRVPTVLANGILAVSDDPIVLLAMINLLLLMLGAIMDMAPLILILTPILLPIVTADPINMSAVHFGIVLLLNLGLGLTTPPVGTALFVGCAIGKIRIERAARAMVYLWPPLVVVLILVTYFPWFVEVVPRLFGISE